MRLALAFIVVLMVAAAVNILVGVHMLAGPAWVFVALGVMLFAAAAFLRSGLKPNG